MAIAEPPTRRTVHYDSLAELLEDAQRISTSETTTVGGWSQGQIFKHLAFTIDASVNGFGFRAPWTLTKITCSLRPPIQIFD